MKNQFNKEKYYTERTEIIKSIKESLPDWEKTQGFVADGIFVPNIYEQQRLKILILLSETYGYGKYGMTDIEQLKNLDGPKSHVHIVPTINKISKLLWVLNKSIREEKELSFDSLPNSYNNTEKLKEQLLKVAWVNIKKESGTNARQDNAALYEHAKKNEKILLKQIASIAPDLIIVCGNVAMSCACNLKLLGGNIEYNSSKRNTVQINETGQRFFFTSHPSYFKHWGYTHIFEYYKTIYKSVEDLIVRV
jgi:hypothetical protein